MWLYSPKAKVNNDKITEYIELEDYPFSVAEDQRFCQLLAHLETWYFSRAAASLQHTPTCPVRVWSSHIFIF